MDINGATARDAKGLILGLLDDKQMCNTGATGRYAKGLILGLLDDK